MFTHFRLEQQERLGGLMQFSGDVESDPGSESEPETLGPTPFSRSRSRSPSLSDLVAPCGSGFDYLGDSIPAETRVENNFSATSDF